MTKQLVYDYNIFRPKFTDKSFWRIGSRRIVLRSGHPYFLLYCVIRADPCFHYVILSYILPHASRRTVLHATPQATKLFAREEASRRKCTLQVHSVSQWQWTLLATVLLPLHHYDKLVWLLSGISCRVVLWSQSISRIVVRMEWGAKRLSKLLHYSHTAADLPSSPLHRLDK